MVKIDTAWFADRIRESRYGSQRALAPHMKNRLGAPLDAGALSLLLQGKRSMTLAEIEQLVTLLEVPMVEALSRAGLKMPRLPQTTDQVIAIRVDPKGGSAVITVPATGDLPVGVSLSFQKVGAGSLVIREASKPAKKKR
jgi:hypothetical protein